MARKKNTEAPVTEEVKTQDPTVTSETPVISNEESEKQEQDTVEITAADLVPVIQQKGVDMRLGLDIAALTLKDQVKVIVLVAGDSDFVPAMKFARREGAQLFLAPLGHGIKEPMREHADLVLEIT